MQKIDRPVLYVTRMVPHYRREALSLLNQRLGDRLVVCSGNPPSNSSLQSLTSEHQPPYHTITLQNYWVGKEKIHFQPFGEVFRQFPHPSVVIAEESVRSLTLPFLLRQARRRGASCLLWGHFSSNGLPFDVDSLKTRYRLALARRVDGCICYSEPIADQLRPHISSERLFVAPNTLDTGNLLTIYDELKLSGRDSVRDRLGIPRESAVIVFMGRLIKSKGISQLLSVFEILRERIPNATLLIIGGGAEKEKVDAFARKHGQVMVFGPITSWKKSAPYLFAADVLLNPGYLGLSINHAFAMGLPVVSQQSPSPHIRYHSPEIVYLEQRKNGILSPFGDLEAMAGAVEEVLENQCTYAQNALSFARKNLGLEKMVDGLANAVAYAEQIAN